jgi:hypothetical protein
MIGERRNMAATDRPVFDPSALHFLPWFHHVEAHSESRGELPLEVETEQGGVVVAATSYQN